MKRISLIFVGIALLLPAPSVRAQPTTPISQHYVQEVLDRITDGITEAQTSNPTGFYDFFHAGWIRRLESATSHLIDTEDRVVIHERNLPTMTACLDMDIVILQNKMQEIAEELNRAIDDNRTLDIALLEDLMVYANERLSHLIAGATDNLYVDTTFYDKHRFDKEMWCCPEGNSQEVCTDTLVKADCKADGGILFRTWEKCAERCQPPDPIPDEDLACPFDSDYLPPSTAYIPATRLSGLGSQEIVGWGCDVDALNATEADQHTPSQEERDALELDLMPARREFLEDSRQTKTVVDAFEQVALEGFTSSNSVSSPVIPTTYPPALERVHVRRIGCNTFAEPTTEDPQKEFDPPPPWPKGATRIAYRGPFSTQPDDISVLRQLQKQLQEWGDRREDALHYTYIEDFPEGSQERADAEVREEEYDIINSFIRSFDRIYYRSVNIQMALRETPIVSLQTGFEEELHEMLKPLRLEVQTFGELASESQKGPRKFNEELTRFLGRSCIFRPCLKQLDHVAKLNRTSTCFPYTTGQYLGRQKLHESCRDGADVREGFGFSSSSPTAIPVVTP